MWFCTVFSVTVYLLIQTSEAQHIPNGNRTCEKGWKEFGSHCYWFSDPTYGLFTSNESEMLCRTKKSALVSIHSPEENKYVADTLVITGRQGDTGNIRYSCDKIGGKWSDGSLMDYKNTKRYACNDEHPTAHYMSTSSSTYGYWFNVVSTHVHRIICKKPLPVKKSTQL